MEIRNGKHVKNVIVSVIVVLCFESVLSIDNSTKTKLASHNETILNDISFLDDLNVLPIETEDPHTTAESKYESKIITIYINLDTLEYTSVQSVNYPEPYPPEEYEWIVNDGGGYGVEIIVRSLDLNGNTDDYLLIKPGGKNDSEENAILFTWKLKSEKKFKLLHKDQFYIKFSAKSEERAHKGFKIDMRRVGEIVTTTEEPTTTLGPIIYDPSQNSTIYLKGLNYNDYTNTTIKKLSEIMAEIAIEYCIMENITIDEDIEVIDNVKFHEIGRCKLDWVDSKICTYILYSIAVNNKSDEYELTTEHLDDMIEKYSKQMNLSSLGLEIYERKDDFKVVLVWILIFVGVTIVFSVMLCVIWRSNWFAEHPRSSFFYDDYEKKKRDEDLFPIPHQPVPPLIGLESYPDEFWNKDIDNEYTDRETNYIRGNDNLGYSIMESDEMFMSEDITETTLRRSIDTIEADESHS